MAMEAAGGGDAGLAWLDDIAEVALGFLDTQVAIVDLYVFWDGLDGMLDELASLAPLVRAVLLVARGPLEDHDPDLLPVLDLLGCLD